MQTGGDASPPVFLPRFPLAYATIQSMTERFTEAELRQLAPLAGQPGQIDAVRAQRALDDASAEMDSYLAVRFPTPVTGELPLLTKAACDIAREDLARAPSDAVVAAAKRAREWLKAVAKGAASLGSGPDGDPDAVPEADAGGAMVSAPERVFTDDSLKAFLS